MGSTSIETRLDRLEAGIDDDPIAVMTAAHALMEAIDELKVRASDLRARSALVANQREGLGHLRLSRVLGVSKPLAQQIVKRGRDLEAGTATHEGRTANRAHRSEG